MEHITSERLAAALTAFLAQSPVAPSGGLPLNRCSAGAQGRIAIAELEPATMAFLQSQGLGAGVQAEVLAVGGDGAVLLCAAGRQLALAPAIATHITLIDA